MDLDVEKHEVGEHDAGEPMEDKGIKHILHSEVRKVVTEEATSQISPKVSKGGKPKVNKGGQLEVNKRRVHCHRASNRSNQKVLQLYLLVSKSEN